MPIIITPDSREHWLELRREDVTSTESAALFGLSPYATEFEMFHRKRGNVETQIEQNERMTWGLRLQDAIAHGVAEDMGLTVRRINGYWRHTDEARMGASFDFEIVSHPDGPGLMEVKSVDFRVYRDEWLDDEAPPHIEIQVQHQLEVANREWALIVCLVAGNTPRVIRVARDRQVGDKLRAAIRRFWQRVNANTPPAVDFVKDADTIREIYRNGSGAPLDATGNNRLHSLALSYTSAARDEKDAVARKEAARSEILTLIGDAGKVTGEGWTLTATETKGSAGTTITPDMVGTVIGARSGYRQFRLNLKEGA